ncbi:four-carbon acid sugar kinase family protein [Microbacterium aquimaris]|uniref:3-oxo-tetronate kinase n=1 Tax=Microbacterium aquimaris TaxID=459816 RepID=UPI002AD38D6E|nr:3-oxo-tetronate kinase [Microbacterium aquimaris]MDZ8275357.1 four-carbon acid sugar kinase family protein [Microbacterium aquimaris]
MIADDVTGATDVAAALRRAGLRTVLCLQAEIDASVDEVDAIVVGLKTRSIPAAQAVEQSLRALAGLRRVGVTQLYFKYCSTFDSTEHGNIGPVTEALAEAIGATRVVSTPAAPLHGRTVYQGRLFVGEELLDETHMRDHPVTPMRDSSVPRLLRQQSTKEVALIPLGRVRGGVDVLRDAVADASTLHVVVDATEEDDLTVIARAVADHHLVAGSAGLVGALARLRPTNDQPPVKAPTGRTAIIAGSCSRRTLEQVEAFLAAGGAGHQLVASGTESAADLAQRALEWWDALPDGSSGMIYSSAPAAQRSSTSLDTGALYERAAGLVADGLAARGVTRMLIAGGETSGEVVRALGIESAVVGEEVAVGAPWIHAGTGVSLVLKSGNFGEPEMFIEVVDEGQSG